MRSRTLFAIGVAYASLVPPGFTTFLIGITYTLPGGEYLPLYDPSAVGEAILLYMLVFLVPEIIVTRMLYRRQARRLGMVLLVYFLANFILGVIAFESMRTCGFC